MGWYEPVPGEFPTQRPVTRSFDVFSDLRLNKRLSKQPWDWWFETLSCPLWRHCNDSPYHPCGGEYDITFHIWIKWRLQLSYDAMCFSKVIADYSVGSFWCRDGNFLFVAIFVAGSKTLVYKNLVVWAWSADRVHQWMLHYGHYDIIFSYLKASNNIIVTPYQGCGGGWNYRRCYSLFNSLFRLAIQKTPKPCINATRYIPLTKGHWVESLSMWWHNYVPLHQNFALESLIHHRLFNFAEIVNRVWFVNWSSREIYFAITELNILTGYIPLIFFDN